MKYRKIVVLASVCAVLGIGAYFSGQKGGSVTAGAADNPGISDPSKISEIRIKSADTEVNILLKDGIWKVKEKQDFPADFNYAREIVSQFQDMKIDRSFDSDEETLKRLGLSSEKTSDIKTSTIVFSGADNKVMAEYILGASRKGGGQYLVRKDMKPIFLTLKEISGLGRNPKDLMNRQIVNPDKEKVVKITCEKAGQTLYTLEKAKDSDQFVLAGKDQNRETDAAKIAGIAGSVSPFMIDDLAPERLASKADEAVFAFELKDGSILKIVPADQKAPDSEVLAVNLELTKKDGDAALIKGADIDKYTFIIPKWKKDVLVANIDDLYKKTAEKAENIMETSPEPEPGKKPAEVEPPKETKK